MEKGIIDRIEGDCAVVETDRGMINLPAVPFAKEGDCVVTDGDKILSVDREETCRRRTLMEKKLRGLLNRKE